MKFNPTVTSIHSGVRDARLADVSTPVFRRSRLDTVFHAVLIAAVFAIAADAAIQSALDASVFDAEHLAATEKTRNRAPRVAENAASPATLRDVSPFTRVKS
jgi:hypothetical protein